MTSIRALVVAAALACAGGLSARGQAPPASPDTLAPVVTMFWSGGLPIPEALFAHRAVLYTRDGVPFSEVYEVYQRRILP